MARNRKAERRKRVKYVIRHKISGTADAPRLSVFRSNKHTYAQLIDDVNGTTLAAASTLKTSEGGSPVDAARKVGEELASRAKDAGVKSAVFDRNGYRYHGRVKAVAEGAREAGLQI